MVRAVVIVTEDDNNNKYNSGTKLDIIFNQHQILGFLNKEH
jgi:hypothetical protein